MSDRALDVILATVLIVAVSALLAVVYAWGLDMQAARLAEELAP